MTTFPPLAGLVLLLWPLQGVEGRETTPVDFAREILPVLSNKCFVCHGPAGREKKVLRLDSQAGAVRDLGGYRAIDPQNLEKSEILARIHDAKDPMPPKKSDRKLTQKERDLISRWIRQGGKYAKHWAFIPPGKTQPANQRVAARSVIDAFILERLQAKGVRFAPEADRATLARRVALVLTGLPPEPEQLSAFLADTGAHAYEGLVDRLLAGPRYGEHQARYWLDAVRYGDTHGLHLDSRRGIYPYRDWVVQAFNSNLPLNAFITWQLAGDLLPHPTLAQRVATGFVRMNPTTAEGGAIPDEFQAKNSFDRTETLGTVLLGMSLTCARCHTHKYDPIPQTEYYRLLAFFNSTSDKPMDGNSYTHGPVVKVPENGVAWNTWSAIESARDKLLVRARAAAKAGLPALVAYAETRSQWKSKDWRISKPVATKAMDPPKAGWGAAKGLPGVRRGNLPKSDKALWVLFQVTVPEDQVLWLTFSGGPGSQARVDGSPVPAAAGGAPAQRTASVPLALARGAHQVQLKMVGTRVGTRIQARLENPWQAVAKSKSWEASSKKDRLRMLADSKGPLGSLRLHGQARDNLQRIAAAESTFTTSLVAQDLRKPRITRLLRRGEYNHPVGDPLQPGILTVMGSFPKDAPRNRLGLARWLTAREHPLVARVLINRVWQRTFGHGLVRTPEDFGLQGQQPTHPQLLDWLAVELQDSGWDLKHMLRLMVTSRTFRQTSVWRRDVEDPENRLFARGPRYRLDAEVLRDMGLWASGLLRPEMGGEGIKPYQPPGLWKALAHPASNTKQYVPDKGEKIYRRSLYVYWKRTSPHPMMTLFDAPSRESSCVKRSRSDTPLQSLALFNETQRMEMSRKFAERVLREVKGDDARLTHMFTLLACRAPSGGERRACNTLLRIMKARYREAKGDALALIGAGKGPAQAGDDKLDPVEHAAWTQLAATVLASDVSILLY